MLNSSNVLKLVDCNLSLEKWYRKQVDFICVHSRWRGLIVLHRDQLFVRQQILEILDIFDAEAQLGWTWIIREDIHNASGERKHHVAGHFHLAFWLVAAPAMRVIPIYGRGFFDGSKIEFTWNMHARFRGMPQPAVWCRWCRWLTATDLAMIHRQCWPFEIPGYPRCRLAISSMDWRVPFPMPPRTCVTVVAVWQYCWPMWASVFGVPCGWMWPTPAPTQWCHQFPRIYRQDPHTWSCGMTKMNIFSYLFDFKFSDDLGMMFTSTYSTWKTWDSVAVRMDGMRWAWMSSMRPDFDVAETN